MDDLLRWSDELESLSLDGEPLSDVPDYLFRPSDRFSEEFWGLATELRQLNDFCVVFLTSTQEHLDNLREGLQELRSRKREDTHFEIMILPDEIPIWEDTHHFLCRSTCLVLLLAFVERSLKKLIESLMEDAHPTRHSNSPKSKIATYLDTLSEMCGVIFKEPEDLVRCRRVRNAFAHGDWQEVRTLVGGVHLRVVFNAVSKLLCDIENAMWKSI